MLNALEITRLHDEATIKRIVVPTALPGIIPLWILLTVAGIMVGRVVGSAWLRRHRGDAVPYGDVRQRRLSDYRSPLFLLCGDYPKFL